MTLTTFSKPTKQMITFWFVSKMSCFFFEQFRVLDVCSLFLSPATTQIDRETTAIKRLE